MTKPRIYIKISGGRVQGTVADIPCDIEILDYDIDGAEDDELYAVPEKDGEIDDCIVYSEQPLVDPEYCDAIETALTYDEEGSESVHEGDIGPMSAEPGRGND